MISCESLFFEVKKCLGKFAHFPESIKAVQNKPGRVLFSVFNLFCGEAKSFSTESFERSSRDLELENTPQDIVKSGGCCGSWETESEMPQDIVTSGGRKEENNGSDSDSVGVEGVGEWERMRLRYFYTFTLLSLNQS